VRVNGTGLPNLGEWTVYWKDLARIQGQCGRAVIRRASGPVGAGRPPGERPSIGARNRPVV